MLFDRLRSKKSRNSKQSAPGRDQKASFKPQLEALEDRTLLSAGSLDPNFGTGGLLKTTFNYSVSDFTNTGFKTLAVQADGKFVIADVSNGGTPGFTVARFNTDGGPDATFGTGGFASVQFAPGSVDKAVAVAVQADGKIVVDGTTTLAGNSNIGVTRFNANGTLDTAFGFNQNGLVVIDFTAPGALAHLNTIASTMTIESDGRIVVGGSAGPFGPQPSGVPVVDFVVARLNGDGTQDADFDGDGRVVMNVGATLSGGKFVTTDFLSDIIAQQDGKLVAVGWTNIENDAKAVDLADNFAIARFNPDGTLDRSFQATGVVSYDLSLSPYGISGPSPFKDRAYSVAIQLDGKILVSGVSQDQVLGSGGNPPAALTQDNFATIRLNTNGTFDNTFTADGVAITDFAPDFSLGSEDQANQVTVQADGRVLVTGFTTTTSVNPGPTSTPNANNKNFALARYNADGTLDQTFGFHGKVIIDVGAGTSDYANQAAVLTNGEFLVAGGVGDNPNATLALALFTGFLPGSIQFSSPTYSVPENGGSATITVTRIGGFDGTATVQFSTTAGTAVPGTDYTPKVGTLTFLPGVASQTFTVSVRDDGVFQSSNKTLNLTLTNLTGGPTFGIPVTATLTLVETDTPGGNINPGNGPVPSTANQKFVNQVYLDLLGRPADAAGLAAFSAYLDAGGSRLFVVQTIEASPEYRTDVVKALYLQYLHRAADAPGLAAFTAVLAAGGTDEQVAIAMLSSAEYFQNRGGGTNDGFVTAIYLDALHRPADANGRAYFDQLLQSGVTTTQVATTILTSVEYDTVLVSGWYTAFLRRTADAAGLAYFVNLMQSGLHGPQPIFGSDPTQLHRITDEFIMALIISSNEYYQRIP